MRAARYYGKEDIRIEQIDEPPVGPGQIKVSRHWFYCNFDTFPVARLPIDNALNDSLILLGSLLPRLWAFVARISTSISEAQISAPQLPTPSLARRFP